MGSFNWAQAITAVFEEPYAVSLLAGNVVAFDAAGSRDIKGNGYSGDLYSAGTYHIRNNTVVRDRWQEVEWKMKDDRKSEEVSPLNNSGFECTNDLDRRTLSAIRHYVNLDK